MLSDPPDRRGVVCSASPASLDSRNAGEDGVLLSWISVNGVPLVDATFVSPTKLIFTE